MDYGWATPVDAVCDAQAMGLRAGEALDFLRVTYRPLMLATGRRLSGRNADENANQGAELGLMLAVRRFDSSCGAAFGQFAKKYVVGEVSRAVRAETRFNEEPLDSLPSEQEIIEDPDIEAINSGIDEVQRTAIREFVAALPDQQRRVVGLHFWGRLPQAEIARRLGISRARVGALLSKVYAKGQVVFAGQAPN